MKITRTALISIFTVLVLAGGIVLGVMYNNANSARNQAQNNLDDAKLQQTILKMQKINLGKQLDEANATVGSWNDKIALLQTELEKANLSLNQVQGNFPPSAETIEYNEALMALAQSCNLNLSIISASEAAIADISSSQYSFNSNIFSVSVTGQMSDILDFISKIASSDVFKTGAISPVSFNVPESITQAEKDQMKSDIRARMIEEKDASIVGINRVLMIEQAFYTLLGESVDQPSPDEVAQAIRDIIGEQFGPTVANLLADQITLAIQENLANSLIDTISSIYADAIAGLFQDDASDLLPQFTGTDLSDAINEAIQGIPSSEIPGVVQTVISDRLNALMMDEIVAEVNESDVDAELAAEVAAAEKLPSAQLTVAVYSYEGD